MWIMRILIFFILFFLIFPTLSFSEDNYDFKQNSGYWLNGGKKKDDWSWAIGGRGNRLGIELGYVVNSEVPDDMLEYPIPHNSYTDKGYKDNDGIGFDLLAFLNSNDLNINQLPFAFSIYGGVGVYWMEESHVVKSNVTNLYYEQRSRDETKYPISYGVQFRGKKDGSLMISIGNHELRGLNFSLGVLY